MQIATPYSLKCYFLVYYEELLHFRIVQFLQCFRARDIEMGSDNTRKKQGQIIFDVRISVYKKIGKIRDFFIIEEVERGAEVTFSGRGLATGPLVVSSRFDYLGFFGKTTSRFQNTTKTTFLSTI